MTSLTQASQAIFQYAGLTASLFPPNSRYQGIDTGSYTTPGGQTIAYVRRRFVPPPSAYALLQQHTVAQGERLDNMANEFLGDPQLFWRLCDANGAMRPEELETPGLVLAITLPQGIAGPPQNG
jgi:hypothetical protein